jgi:transcriptional regulator with XRE-family HTH domain
VIREAKKLTQLYVANVVGVTTDTISRWENNRYPSIKRDNAEKLAIALEVSLEEIIRPEEAETPPVEPGPAPTSPPRSRPRWGVIALIALLLPAAILLLVTHRRDETPVAVRTLPPFAAPGATIPVQVKIISNGPTGKGYILKEQFPKGWRLVSALPPVPADREAAGTAKWLLPAAEGQQTVSYTVRIPPDQPLKGKVTFVGSVVTHSGDQARTDAVGGSSTVVVADRHWADRNGDGRIDDTEIMPAYYMCEEMKGLGLDWKSIESIWNGRGYRWDSASGTFAVVK